MSYNTQCPTCTTVFLVTPEALAVAGGWVRCGRCSGVFDAVAQRYTAPPSALPVTAAIATVPVTEDLASGDEVVSPRIADSPEREWDSSRINRRIRRSQEKLDQAIAQVLATEQIGLPDQSLGEELPTQAPSTGSDEPSGSSDFVAGQASAERTEGRASPRFVRPRVTEFLALAVALVLALLLAVQWVVAYRDKLVSHYSVLRPWVLALCDQLGCKLEGLRELDKIVIENTALLSVDVGPDEVKRYQLMWELSNQALYPIQAPALELILNDALDRPVIRKVLLPSALGSKDSTRLGPEENWRGEVQIKVNEPVGGVKIAGYRVIAFYP